MMALIDQHQKQLAVLQSESFAINGKSIGVFKHKYQISGFSVYLVQICMYMQSRMAPGALGHKKVFDLVLYVSRVLTSWGVSGQGLNVCTTCVILNFVFSKCPEFIDT